MMDILVTIIIGDIDETADDPEVVEHEDERTMVFKNVEQMDFQEQVSMSSHVSAILADVLNENI